MNWIHIVLVFAVYAAADARLSSGVTKRCPERKRIGVYCGLGGVRCPLGSECWAHPTDLWADCCSTSGPVKPTCPRRGNPLTNPDGSIYMCNNRTGARCPSRWTCVTANEYVGGICCRRRPYRPVRNY